MEKQSAPKLPVDVIDPQVEGRTSQSERRGRTATRWLKIAVGTFVVLSYLHWRGAVVDWHGTTSEESLSAEFSWEQLVPSEKFNWVPCYEKFQCTRLSVPLDYAKPEGSKAAIAVIRFPSKYPVGHEMWRGPILYNPGGPGGSGVDFLTAPGLADGFASVIGDDYDHVSFDPRGIAYTTPVAEIFTTPAERATWNLRDGPLINSTDDALSVAYAQSVILGKLAEERIKDVAEHVSTAVVARDMLSITRAYGREKILYWGFSYGTVLGITYASMFPDNIERLIVDGVVDTVNYYKAAWSNNLLDTNAVLSLIWESCAASSACPLREPTPEAVEKRVLSVIDSLKTNPLPIVNGADYGVLDWDTAWKAFFFRLYSPFDGIPQFFSSLADLERGDGRAMYHSAKFPDSSFECKCDGKRVRPGPLILETWLPIACSDGDDVTGEDLSTLKKHYEEIYETSGFANFWFKLHTACTGWRVRPAERFAGPFVGNTSFPLLFIGNTADPVTPLWAANKMSKGFKDAALLTQNTPGHCSLAATSLCTAKHVRGYFRDGTLPSNGTVCETAEHIFPPDNASLVPMKTLSADEEALYEAMRSLSNSFAPPRLGF
ncbi:alpha/beta-hydrolase [Sistotremastrum niveocremeum HHB9708]|uniref:Alpha/beta-hydrolase n=1 Tax=Sistotremastrum niveocremeum HHB9708 TaxID=1314777 RepID=A0A164X7D2_9AGAM|nr:alpha/beta-hydrolase [Sistotremastrum niveocremeum HHB9708]